MWPRRHGRRKCGSEECFILRAAVASGCWDKTPHAGGSGAPRALCQCKNPSPDPGDPRDPPMSIESARPRSRGADRGGQAARLLGPVGCDGCPPCTSGLSTWSSSRSLRGPNSAGNLVSEGASRLDAFSAYPDPTWLPGGAADATTGTPEVGPPQSSRTRGESPQVSHAHGR